MPSYTTSFELKERNRHLRTIVTSSLLLVFSISAYSQSFRGIVRSNATGEPLPYASVGVKNKNIGCIADQNGVFTINIDEATETDTIIIRYIGYSSAYYTLSEIDSEKRYHVDLKPISYKLEAIVIEGNPDKIILGNKRKTHHHTGWGDFKSSRGRTVGLLLRTPDRPLKVNKLFFHQNACEFDSARVRIHFLSFEGEKLIPLESQKDNLFFTVRKGKGWQEVKLAQDIIIRKKRIVVAIEWVDAWAKIRTPEEGGSYLFTLSLSKSPGQYYIRQTSEEIVNFVTSDRTPSIYLECVAIKY